MKNTSSHSFLCIALVIWVSIGSLMADPGHFPHKNDTLILKTSKHKGFGLFDNAHWGLMVEEIDENEEWMDVIPAGISDAQLARDYIDIKFSIYENVRRNNPENLSEWINRNYPGIDTTNIPSERENTVKVLLGTQDGKKIYIVDQNNNHDFRDDVIRTLNKFNYDVPMPEPVPCHYRVYNGREWVQDSGWVHIGLNGSNKPTISVAQHLTAKGSVDSKSFELQIVNWAPYLRFCFETPLISIVAENGARKDSLLFSERLELGQYLKLGDSYYRFDKITNDGSEITLIREEDVSGIVGDQIGFIAPDFDGVSIMGDSVSLSDYRGKYVLITNITACWSDPMSYEHYKALSEEYLPVLDILAVDASAAPLQANIDNLGLNGSFFLVTDNPAIKRNYREDFCSRVCFLIGPEGHIIDKFEIGDWKSSLSMHFK